MLEEPEPPTPDTTATEDTTTTEDEAFKRRFAKSATMARMLLIQLSEMHKGAYHWTENIAAVLPHVFIMALLIENDYRKRPPLTPTQIEERERIPRKSASRYLNRLVRHGLAVKKDKGYATNPDYWRATINARYVRRSAAVFSIGGHILRKLKKK